MIVDKGCFDTYEWQMVSQIPRNKGRESENCMGG